MKNTGQCKKVMDLISAFCENKQELYRPKQNTVGENENIKERKMKEKVEYGVPMHR